MPLQALSRLRYPVDRAIGRRYPEAQHIYRNEFQRDRDRIVHSRAFRRLENKTQVFTPTLSDHFRNRLTHTIEVSQISRTVAGVLGLDEDLTEALALAHDIGHPPFAHAGEGELDRQMRRFGERFNHNLHALRLVETFEQRYARFPGLNLTFEVREGIAKHSRDFARGEFPLLDEYFPGLRPPLEAQLIDLADEIAYNTADLDDACSAGMFRTEEIVEAIPEYGAMWEDSEMQFPGASERVKFQETLRSLVDYLASSLIDGTCQAAVDSGAASMEDVRRHPRRLARLTASAETTAAALKRFLHQRVYFAEELLAARARSVAMIADLFTLLMERPEQLPENYREEARQQPLHRVVCDYIAGMTDGYCTRMHQQLVGS